jgi:hypothetical protein
LFLSVVWSTHFPEQATCVPEQAHTPPMHEAPLAHTFPQAPQLFVSAVWSTHFPEQTNCVLGQAQAPPMHEVPPAHTFPQAPQLDALVALSTQMPPQRSCVPGQALHMPAVFVVPPSEELSSIRASVKVNGPATVEFVPMIWMAGLAQISPPLVTAGPEPEAVLVEAKVTVMSHAIEALSAYTLNVAALPMIGADLPPRARQLGHELPAYDKVTLDSKLMMSVSLASIRILLPLPANCPSHSPARLKRQAPLLSHAGAPTGQSVLSRQEMH